VGTRGVLDLVQRGVNLQLLGESIDKLGPVSGRKRAVLNRLTTVMKLQLKEGLTIEGAGPLGGEGMPQDKRGELALGFEGEGPRRHTEEVLRGEAVEDVLDLHLRHLIRDSGLPEDPVGVRGGALLIMQGGG
jgi:hypothetical protein